MDVSGCDVLGTTELGSGELGLKALRSYVQYVR